MATIDWPTDRAFLPADFSVGADVPLAQWRAPNTGTREVYSRAADRMTCQLSLPPCKRADAARIESYLAGLLSTGDNVRFPMFHRRTPRGAFGGSPTVNGAVAAGARTLNLQAAISRPNLLKNSSFEIDTDANGISDNWNAYSLGSTGSLAWSLIAAGTHGTKAQQSFAAALGVGTGNRVGVAQTVLFTAGVNSRASFSVDVRGTASATVVANIDWLDASNVYISSSNASLSPNNTLFQRLAVQNVVVPSNAARADCYVWLQNGTGGNCGMDIDAAQFEFSLTASAFVGFPALAGGDFFAVGGNLLQVAYAGATLNDAGAGAVPLAYPVQKAISTGAAVTWDSPTGVWQLDAAGITFDYSAGVIMNGLVLPFRQVVV